MNISLLKTRTKSMKAIFYQIASVTKIGIISLLLSAGINPLNAQTNWINPGSGDWNTPGNWSAGVPNGGVTAFIVNNGESVLSAGGSVNLLNVGTIVTSTNSRLLIQSNGNLSSSGVATIGNTGGTGFATITGPLANWVAPGIVVGNAGTGTLTVDNGANINLPLTSSLTLGSTAAGNGTLNVNGTSGSRGRITTFSIIAGPGTTTANFDGGILRSIVASPSLISGFGPNEFNILNGGIFFEVSGANVPSVLSGPGFVSSSGNLTLSGSNLYTGGTTIPIGVLSITNNNSLSTGLVTFDSPIVQPDAPIILALANITLSNNFLVAGVQKAGLNTNFNTLILNGTVTGSSGIEKQGIGLLALNGVNTYTGGTDLLTDTLSINNGSSLGTGPLTFVTTGDAKTLLATANLTLNIPVILNDPVQPTIDTQANNVTISGSMTGASGFVKTGTGTLALSGINSYSGGTTINQGTLLGNSNSLQGNIVDNAVLEFNQGFDGTYAGSISGAGIFNKTGAGKLQLTGNSAAFTGPTQILAGNLNVNGILGGNTTVFNGATLSGNGFLNNVFNSGIVSPGNSIGTLHVNNFVNNPDGTVIFEISPNGTSDLIEAAGTVSLLGGEVDVLAEPGIYLNGTTYTLITAAGGLNGQFATANISNLITASLTYLPNSLILTIIGNTFNINGLTGNPLRVARYIRDNMDSDGDFTTVLNALGTLNTAQLQTALDQLHPAIFEALALTVGNTAHMINTTFTDRLSFLRNIKDPCDPCQLGCGAWVAGSADFLRQSRVDGLRKFNTSSEGISFGVDNMLSQSLVTGLGAGYSFTNLHWGNGAGRADINSFYLGAYASKYEDNYYIDASLLAFVNHHRSRRHIHFATIDRKAKSSHYSYGFNPHLGAGLNLNYCTVDVIPFFNLDYYLVQQNRSREHGADSLDLSVKRNQSNLIRAEIGVQFTKSYQIGCGTLIPNISISWVGHKLMSGDRYISAFRGIESNFSVFGTRHCFNQLELGAGATYVINKHLAVNAWYDVELGRKRQEQNVNVEVNYNF